MLLQKFDIEISDKKGTENMVTGNLFRLIYFKKEELPLDGSFPNDKLFVLIQK